MAVLIDVDDEPDFVRCSRCRKQFSLVWQRQYAGECVEYCPFCGDEIVTAEKGGG